MSTPLHKTRGIVLRAVKYGETSLIVTVFTELFGVQSYMVNGVRTSAKRSMGKSQFFQPAALLDLVVYHNELKHLNRIREFQWHTIYDKLFSDVPRNTVALFMVELLNKCLKQPEANPELFYFVEDVMKELDKSNDAVMANLPLFFALHLSHFFGFRIDDNYSEANPILDLQEGCFVSKAPHHPYFLEDKAAFVCSQLLKVMQVSELEDIKMNAMFRRALIQQLEHFYAIHIPEFGTLKTLPILRAILE
jgi:DNA repair protein RecO (recombination protein O)